MGTKVNHRQAASNYNWMLWQNDDGTFNNDQVQLALLMDIRAELQRMNQVLQCSNTIRIPRILDQIAENTIKPVRKPAKKRK